MGCFILAECIFFVFAQFAMVVAYGGEFALYGNVFSNGNFLNVGVVNIGEIYNFVVFANPSPGMEIPLFFQIIFDADIDED